jgi:hypothetical protein
VLLGRSQEAEAQWQQICRSCYENAVRIGEEHTRVWIGVNDHLPTPSTRWDITVPPDGDRQHFHGILTQVDRRIECGLLGVEYSGETLILHIPTANRILGTFDANRCADAEL